jgi:hypothetical protein
MFHREEHLAKRIKYLGHGRYLPVEVTATDFYGKGNHRHTGLREIDPHVNVLAVKVESGSVEPEVFCSPRKLQELWNGKRELLEVANLEILEARGGDPTKNCFRVCAHSLEAKCAKVRKRDVCRDGCAHELRLHIAVGNRGVKEDPEDLQLGHH